MNKIIDKLLSKRIDSILNTIQSKITWGMESNAPRGLSLDELRIWTRVEYDTQRQIYYIIEEFKSKPIESVEAEMYRLQKHTDKYIEKNRQLKPL